MLDKDLEKKRAADRKYRQSKKGKAATKCWLEAHKSELAKKREEKREKRFEAFCRWYSIDIWCMRRLIAMHKKGIDIEYDPLARYVYKWEHREMKDKEAAVKSLDYI